MIKYSKQREAIKNQLSDRKDHPTAETLYTCLLYTSPAQVQVSRGLLSEGSCSFYLRNPIYITGDIVQLPARDQRRRRQRALQ